MNAARGLNHQALSARYECPTYLKKKEERDGQITVWHPKGHGWMGNHEGIRKIPI